LTLARLHLAQGQPEAALECLCARLPAAEADGRLGHAAENLLLQALAEQALGQPTRATERLQHALALAEPGGYTRLFLAPGRSLRPPLAALLARAAARSAYAQRLLAAAERPGGAPQASPPAPPAPPVALPLTPGERRVVALIARGLSNDEIGRRLGISLNTVRTHNKSIFRKLDVSSRTQAAARAREAGLA
jgi:LuxR family maltose regulon positive regulatory protein